MKHDKQDVYDEITQRIIAALEAGVAPWVKPWDAKEASHYGAGDALPFNGSTGRHYSGINVILLWLFGPQGTPAYVTYKQATAIGAQVRAGSKGYRIVYASSYEKAKVTDSGAVERESYFFLKRHTVFHLSQIDNLPADYEAKQPDEYATLDDSAFNAWVSSTGAIIRPGGSGASYMPYCDAIGMPPLQTFKTPDDYKATLLHELVHWTGHKSRLARELKTSWSHAYAREELVAEMGAAFLCARHGITAQLQHAEYIGHWVKCLREDNKAIFRAAAAAQKAADYLFDLQTKPVPAARALTLYRPQLPAVQFTLAA